MVTEAGNQGQLPWLATLVTKVTTMVTTMVTMMVTTMVTTMITITNLGYRGCVTDYYSITVNGEVGGDKLRWMRICLAFVGPRITLIQSLNS